jgi:hypothetical protein
MVGNIRARPGVGMNDQIREEVYNGFLTGYLLNQYIDFWMSDVGWWGANNDIYHKFMPN